MFYTANPRRIAQCHGNAIITCVQPKKTLEKKKQKTNFSDRDKDKRQYRFGHPRGGMFGAAAERTWPLQWHPHTPSKSKHCHQHLAAVPCSAQAAPAPRSTLQRHRQPRSKASKAHAAINIWHGHPAAALAHSRRHLAATPGRQPAGAPASKLQSTHSRVVGGVVSFQSLSLE